MVNLLDFFLLMKMFEGCIAVSTTSDSENLICTELRKRKLYVTPYSVSTVCRIHACRDLYGVTIREGVPLPHQTVLNKYELIKM